MRTTLATLALAGALVLTVPASAQTANRLYLTNGSEAITIYGDPSTGSPTGTFPPDYTGDMFWKTTPGAALNCAAGTIGLNGLYFTLGDTDYSTQPNFHDMIIGEAIDSALGSGVSPGNLEPEFFSGPDNGTWISLGPSGLGNPGCAPAGSLYIYNITANFSAPITIPCDGVKNTAVTYLLPGGMTFTGGACSQGDYVTQGSVSTNENQYDIVAGGGVGGLVSVTDGRQQGFSGPLPEPAQDTIRTYLLLPGPIMNARVGDAQFGLETGLASLWLSVGSGTATIGAEMTDRGGAIGGHFAVCAASAATLPAPGVATSFGILMLIPDPIFNLTASNWLGSVGWVSGTGVFRSAQLPVPATAAGLGLKLNLQGFSVNLGTLSGSSSSVFACELHP